MNLELADRIRAAIRDTTGAIAHQETPYPTRTALQAHLDALLKEELRALTGQAPDGNLAGKLNLTVELNAAQAQDELARLREKVNALRGPTPWYPDDSGDWVEGHPRDLPADTIVADWLYREERECRSYCRAAITETAGYLAHQTHIVAYKVVKP